MRRLLVFATLLLFAAPLAAQDVEHPGPDGADVRAEQVEVMTPDVQAVEAEVQIQQIEMMDEAPATAIQPDTRQWWWLVLGIVLAGVILAVIL